MIYPDLEPLSVVIIEAILNNPDVTYEDCDALYFTLLNGDPALYAQYSDEVLRVQEGLV